MDQMENLCQPKRLNLHREPFFSELPRLSDGDLSYLLKIKASGILVKNKPNSVVAYCLGITDEYIPGKEVLEGSGELPDI